PLSVPPAGPQPLGPDPARVGAASQRRRANRCTIDREGEAMVDPYRRSSGQLPRALPGARGRVTVDPGPASTPRAVAGYLVSVRPTIARGAEARHRFIRELGEMLDSVRHGDPA